MKIKRRRFLKLSAAGLAAAGLDSKKLFSFTPPPKSWQSPLREQLLSEEFPFPYDEQYFACGERIYNIRRSAEDSLGWKTNLSLILKENKKLDFKIMVSERLEDLPKTKEVYTFHGVSDSLDVQLAGFESARLFYQVLYREGEEKWKALSPKSFKLPNASLEKESQLSVILLSDDHTFDDADGYVPDAYKEIKLSGDYINDFLKWLRFNPSWLPPESLNSQKNGYCLATAIRYIMAYEDPDIIINLGDTNGIGANYKWAGLGLPTKNLTEKDYDYICRVLWLRMRKIYSALTPNVPVLIALGNHDGEEGWNSARFKAREWRKKLFPLPDSLAYPEGGHSDGNYFAFSWGSDHLNRGGVQFIILDITAFTGNRSPRTPGEWTLGDAQLQWLENVLRNNKKEWVFAFFHHVLGGWPAGPEEARKDIAYGRGPLFSFKDYLDCCDPNTIEQVRITEMGKKYGLRAFFYGHDHIFHVEKIGSGLNQKELLGICCGSTKYMGEDVWWRGTYWQKHYGDGFKTPPDFWGPPGITKLTVKKDEAKVEYIITGFTPHTNQPQGTRVGEILSRITLSNPPPQLAVDKSSLFFQGIEGEANPSPQTFNIKNAGARTLHYQVRKDKAWISVSPQNGTSWGDWNEVTVSIDTQSLEAGSYEGTITIESSEASNSPQKITVSLSVLPPPIYSPLNFTGTRKQNKALFVRESVIFLTWENNPQNKKIQKSRIYIAEDNASLSLLAEVGVNTLSYLFRNAKPQKKYRFSLTAVDYKNREGPPASIIVE